MATNLEEAVLKYFRMYLKTKQFQEVQRLAIAEYGECSRCGVCSTSNDKGESLVTRHRTFKRLGRELPSDLEVICKMCFAHEQSEYLALTKLDFHRPTEEEWTIAAGWPDLAILSDINWKGHEAFAFDVWAATRSIVEVVKAVNSRRAKYRKRYYADPESAQSLPEGLGEETRRVTSSVDARPLSEFTVRQGCIVDYKRAGFTLGEIAVMLGVSYRTVLREIAIAKKLTE